jgi:hypothetical protein
LLFNIGKKKAKEKKLYYMYNFLTPSTSIDVNVAAGLM